MPYSGLVAQAIACSRNVAKNGSLISRQRHYVIFCLKNNIHDFFLPDIPPLQKNYVLACYAASLTDNETLLCRSIRTATIKKYLDAVSELFLAANFYDPTKNLQGLWSTYIHAVLKEHLRWEVVPNRWEPLTYRMVDFAYATLLRRMISDANFQPDLLEECLCDWLILGMQTGFRLSEWCQDSSKMSTVRDIGRNIDSSPKAFIFLDFTFSDKNNVHRNNALDVHIDNAAYVTIRWRFQKNNDNGQKLIFSENATRTDRCPLRAAMRIRAHAQRYNIPATYPIAIFKEKTGTIKLITNKHVETFLQQLARYVYNITKKEDLARFTSHSIRVGACVVLHENNCTSEFIKVRLRWRSDAFLMYLRSTVKLASLHNEAANNSL